MIFVLGKVEMTLSIAVITYIGDWSGTKPTSLWLEVSLQVTILNKLHSYKWLYRLIQSLYDTRRVHVNDYISHSCIVK